MTFAAVALGFSTSVWAQGSDDCATAQPIFGLGPHAFDMSAATTGASYATCGLGPSAFESDVWFVWTAPSSGRATLTDCGSTNVDTKIAVFDGIGCPTAPSIACNDDACPGFQSTVCFAITAGQTYTIEVGTFPGTTPGPGTFSIAISAPLPLCSYDDGSTENLLGWFAGGEMVWLNRFGTPTSSTSLSSVDVMYGSALYPGFNPGNGTPSTIAIWADGASQDGDPGDATLLMLIPSTVSAVDTDTFVTTSVPTLTISGIFFIGAGQVQQAGQYVAPMDQGCETHGVAWFFGDNTGAPVNYATPAANIQPPLTFDSQGYSCQVMIRAGCSSGGPAPFCSPGQGGTIACPCSNPPGGGGRGCDNSSGTGGASIGSSGTPSLGADTLAFTTTGEKPIATSIVLQGTVSNPGGVVFGQGVRCVTGALKRLYVKTASSGSISAPNGTDPSVSSRSAALGDTIVATQHRFYTVYYRDPIVLGGCPVANTFNATNALNVPWGP